MDQMLAIRVLLAAVDGGSLAAAGRKLGLSPAMAGRYVQALESRLHTRLLQRSTRQLILTEAGRRYHDRCLRILAELDDADREAADRDSMLHGTLRVSAPVTFGALHLGQSIAGFLAAHPLARLDLIVTDQSTDLLAAHIDLAIRIGDLADEHLTVRRLASCRLMACASPEYLRMHGTPQAPADLESHACLAFKGAVSAGDWAFTGPDGTQHALPIDPRLAADNMDVLRAAALAHAGIVFGPSFAFADAIADGRLEQVFPGFATASLPVHAVFPTARYIPRMVREFVERLATDFSGVPPWERTKPA